MTDMISRADAIALIEDYLADTGSELEAWDIVQVLSALPAAQVADPAQIRAAALREVLALVRGYLDAWDDATVNGSSISIICDAIEALIHTPPATRKEVMPDDAAEIDGLPRSFDPCPGCTPPPHSFYARRRAQDILKAQAAR